MVVKVVLAGFDSGEGLSCDNELEESTAAPLIPCGIFAYRPRSEFLDDRVPVDIIAHVETPSGRPELIDKSPSLEAC